MSDTFSSVIIPTHNRSTQLRTCLLSVLHQTLPASSYEIIVVDDGSTDNTKSVLHALCEEFPGRITIVTQSNQGCAAARNTGIAASSGSILFFTDDDCIVPPNWMETLLGGFREHPDVVGVGGWCEYEAGGKAQQVYASIMARLWGMQFARFTTYSSYGALIGVSPFGSGPNCAYRKEIFDVVGLFEVHPAVMTGVDLEFAFRLCHFGKPVMYLPISISRSLSGGWGLFWSQTFARGVTEYHLSTKYVIQNMPMHVHLINLFERLAEYRSAYPEAPLISYMMFTLGCIRGARFARSQKWYASAKVPYSNTRRYSLTKYAHGLTQEHIQFAFGEEEQDPKLMRAKSEVKHLLRQHHRTPLVTILIPFYNRESFITPYFIDSLNALEGSDSAVEVIFVDDGSTDETYKKLCDASKQLRFQTRVLTQENGGPAYARNFGMKHAQGEYIFLQDSDVIAPLDWLSCLLAPFRMDERVVLTGGKQRHFRPMTHLDIWRNLSDAEPMPFHIGNRLTYRPYDFANMCVDRKRLLQAGLLYIDKSFTRGVWCEDLDYVLRIQKAGLYSAYVPCYVENRRSMSLQNFFDVCVTREAGMRNLRHHHQDVASILPSYFYVANGYSVIHVVVKIWRHASPWNFFIGYIYHLSVNGKPHNIFVRSCMILARMMRYLG